MYYFKSISPSAFANFKNNTEIFCEAAILKI